jgi:Rrf2 family transcriptional regulator, iron-sulfur cluster assembly transcription factor
MLSKTGVHALAAVAALARLGPGAYAGAGDIAGWIGAPRNYLGKLLKTLADAGILESRKGKGGGFRMGRDPASLPLIRVVENIERIDRWSGCLMSSGKCSDRSPCAAHERWAKVRDAYLEFLEGTTVADLAMEARTRRPPRR